MDVLTQFRQRFEILLREGPIGFVEIFLIFLIFYLFFRFLKTSRGAPVLRGILLVFGLMIAITFVSASVLQMDRITWIFERLVTLLSVAMLIIFQPELRRGLLRLGMTPIFRTVLRPRSEAIDELVESVMLMSKRKTGALIVIERHATLAAFIEPATPLNADVTSELLQTIFFKDSPLHDAAVIVRGSRVAAAGCVLPLSENPELSKTLGTRHRAALGISEETDAVAVVVSEETGRISLAVDGKLKLALSPEELRKLLTELCFESVEGVG